MLNNINYFLSKYGSGKRKNILCIALFMFLSALSELILPQILSSYIDNVLIENIWIPISLAAGYLFMTLFSGMISLLTDFLCEKVGWRICDEIRSDLLMCMTDYGIQYNKMSQSGKLVERIEGDVNLLFYFLSSFLIDILSNSILIIGVIIFLFFVSHWLGICFLIISIIIICVFVFSQKKITKLWIKSRTVDGETLGTFEEFLKGRKDIIGGNHYHWSENKLKDSFYENQKALVKARFIGNLPATFFYSMINIGEGITLAAGVFLYLNQQLTLGECFAIVSYVALLNTPFMYLKNEFAEMPKISAAVYRIREIFSYKEDKGVINKAKEKKNCMDKTMDIVFDNVSFSYGNTNCLKNINFRVKSGEKVLLTGRTGSGKSTLIQLLAGLLTPDSGNITINGINLKDINIDSYYSSISYVSQKTPILEDTLKHNIDFYQEKYTNEQIIWALKKAGLEQWYVGLEQGVDTMLNKHLLNEEQAQLLSWARVILKRPMLILTDEPDSMISKDAMLKIDHILSNECKESTVIMVSHKKKSEIKFDLIISMEDGTISHAERSCYEK